MSRSVLQLIQPISKRDQVVASIKEAILSGKLHPGDTIVESRVAHQLGAGIPLVREALIELEHQGYVQKIPYKGTTVTRLERSSVEQIFRLRVELETLAVKWAKDSVTVEDIAELRDITAQMRSAAEALDLDLFYEKDLAFHRKLWAMSGNDYLFDCLERLVVPLFAFFVIRNRRARDSYLESAATHEEIVDSLQRLNKVKLATLVRKSLIEWRAEVLEELLPSDNE